jgi:glutathione synthase/RimK-type ligase-like ATP-grasp enzyme
MLLIISDLRDFTVDFLITKLLDQEREYYRLNSDDVNNTECFFLLRGRQARRTLAIADKSVDLSEVKSVWYRRMLSPPLNDQVSPDARAFTAREIRHFIEGLVENPAIRWVNPILATSRAELKIYQLRLAADLGFLVPETIVSNDPDLLQQFESAHRGKVISKPICHGLWSTNSERYAIYTDDVSPEDLSDPGQLRLCPTLLQVRVEKGVDVRVTVIGKKVFPVEIHFENQPLLDWRKPGSPISYRLCKDFPDELSSLCLNTLQSLDLLYGAFDFIRTPDNEWYFLEVNPAGEWAWLEQELHLPMSQAFIEIFYD